MSLAADIWLMGYRSLRHSNSSFMWTFQLTHILLPMWCLKHWFSTRGAGSSQRPLAKFQGF